MRSEDSATREEEVYELTIPKHICPADERAALRAMLGEALWYANQQLVDCLDDDRDALRLINIGTGIRAIGRLLQHLPGVKTDE